MKKQQDPNNPAPKAPPSEARRAASRANGAKSRGPRTPEGKKRSCRNALKHGLLAHNVTVSDTETEILETLEQAYTERFTPRDALEFHAVEELAYYKYQMRQTWMMQAATLHVQMVRDFQELAGEWDSIPPLERQAMAITSCLQDGPALLLLERYTRMYANLGRPRPQSNHEVAQGTPPPRRPCRSSGRTRAQTTKRTRERRIPVRSADH